MGKFLAIVLCLACVSCARKDDARTDGMASANFGAMNGKSMIVQKPALIRLGIKPLELDEARAYMGSLYGALVPDLEKTNITYQMAGNDIILTIQSHIVLKDDETILDDIKPQLDGMAATLARFGRTFVEFRGHTSSEGGRNANLRRSLAMATTLADYFIARRLMPERVFVNGAGESMWIADNGTREGRLLNHRVEIRISPVI
ncbi:MAG: OmpA family protein [Rickettsiales bacterium]|jgi:outer membrane protein OmpA-like peptidoglycan-associated protein|nr:OmpA family protein [Rickettsiales bacterium]